MSPTLIAVVCGLISMFCWGMADFFVKKGVDQIGYRKTLVFVYLFSITISLPLLKYETYFPTITPSLFLTLAIFGIFDFIAYICLYKAYEIGKVSIVNPITSTYAVLSAIISFLFFGETFTTGKTIAFILVMIGIVFAAVDFKDIKNGFQKKDIAKGVPLAVLVFVIYGLYIPFWDRFIADKGWVMVSLIVRFIVFILAFATFKMTRNTSLKLPNKNILIWLILIGIFEAIAVSSFNWGISSSTETSILAATSSAYPLVLIATAYLFLKERVAVNQYIGSLLIVAGVVLVSLV